MYVTIWNPILPRMSCCKEYLVVMAVRKGVWRKRSYQQLPSYTVYCSKQSDIYYKYVHAPTTSWGMQHVLGTVDHVEVILLHLKAAIEMHQVNAHRLILPERTVNNVWRPLNNWANKYCSFWYLTKYSELSAFHMLLLHLPHTSQNTTQTTWHILMVVFQPRIYESPMVPSLKGSQQLVEGVHCQTIVL